MVEPVSDQSTASQTTPGLPDLPLHVPGQRHADQFRFWLSAIVESSDDAIVSKNLNGIITSWNQAAQRIFGYTAEQMVGTSILRLIPEELQSEEAEILAKLRAGQRIDHFETIRLRQDGERINVSLTISPVKDASGNIVGASKVLRDVTDRKRMERSLLQAEKLAASGRMAATIAHEINNPLEAVLNLIHLARTDRSDPEQTDGYLSSAEGELIRLAHIAKQTLGFYRETNSPTPVPLSDVVADAIKVYGPKLRTAGVTVHAKLLSTRPLLIKRGEIMQAISNLIANAGYAMPAGGTLDILVQDSIEGGRDGLQLTIRDTGCGIPSENMAKLFEPFYTTRSAIGTGIGLWVAKQFVNGHGGTITLKSSTDPANHGTTATIFLPLNAAPA